MSKHIDAEAFKRRILSYGIVHEGDRIPIPFYKEHCGKMFTELLRWVCEEVDDALAADVKEVRHGRWLMTDAYPHRIYCSNCYGTYALDHWGIWIDGSLPRAYCPNCGAKMEEVERNEN